MNIAWGAGFYAEKDRLISPFRYEDQSMLFNLGYTQQRPDKVTSLQVFYALGSATAATNSYRDYHRISLHHRIQYLVWQDPYWTIYLGGRSGVEGLLTQPVINSQGLEVPLNKSGYFRLPLSVSAGVDWEPRNGHQIHLQSDLPLISYIIRSDYALVAPQSLGELLSRGTLASWNRLQGFGNEVSYSFQYTTQTRLRVTYRAHYLRYDQPLPIKELSQSLIFGLEITL
jgi:hypothetical protein